MRALDTERNWSLSNHFREHCHPDGKTGVRFGSPAFKEAEVENDHFPELPKEVSLKLKLQLSGTDQLIGALELLK